MRNLLLALLTCAVVTATALDSAAQGRGGRGGGGGFQGNNNNDGGGGGGRGGRNEAAPNGAPAQLPQAPADFGAPTSTLPTTPANLFAPPPTSPTTGATPAAGAPAAGTPQVVSAPAAPPKPAPPSTIVRVVDGKVSVQVKEIPLVQLVKLLDEAMGTKSRVKKELETKKMTVRFDDLPYDAAVKKIFQAAQLDYIVLPEGLIVTAPSTTTAGGTSASTTVQPTLPQPTLPNPTVPGLEQSPFGPQGNPPAVPPGALGAENPFTGSPNVGIAPPSSTATPGAPPIAPGGPASGPQPIITAPDFGGATMQGLPTFGGGAPAGGGGQGLGGGGLIPFGQPINP